MARGILIDLDDTLSDDRYAMQKAVLSLCEAHKEYLAVTPDSVSTRWFDITARHWKRFRVGETTLQGQRRDRLSELFSQQLTEPEADQLFAEYLVHYERNWRLTEGADTFLAGTKGIPKVIVTNGEINQSARKVAALNLAGHIFAVVSPEVAGAAKPKPAIFEYALGLLGMPAAECLMIGDSYEDDIAPAKALGMVTFHVGSTPDKCLAAAASAA